MRILVASVMKRRLFGSRRAVARLQQRVEKSLLDTPWRPETTARRDSWTSASGLVRIDGVTNEPVTTGPLLRQGPDGSVMAWTGHVDHLPATLADLSPQAVAGLSGCFALLAVDDKAAHGFTSIHRMEQLYVAEGPDVLVLSTSARVAHRVAGISDSNPVLDALIGLSGAGFMINDATPLPRVYAVPAASRLTLTQGGQRQTSLPPADIDGDAPLEEIAALVADALLDAAAEVGRHNWRRTVDLTGGKDSRLAAVLLATAGVDYVAVTSGLDAHPDVIGARRVAATLGVEHTVLPPAGAVAGQDWVEVWPMRRAYHALRGCDGMLTSYETLNVNSRYVDNALALGGHGGELLRGGFAYGYPPVDEGVLQRRLRQRIAPHRTLLTAQAQARVEELAAPWQEIILADAHRGSEQFYRMIRSGRWHAVARGVYQIRGPRRSILADNRVVHLVSTVRQDITADERLFHAVLHHVRPDLCAIPLYSKRWAFEKSGPAPECDPATWADREPMAGDDQKAWNWKVSYPAEMHRHLMDTVLSAPLYEALLNRAAVEKFFAETVETRTGAQAQQAWALYTTAQLVAGPQFVRSEPDGPVFRIPLPSLEAA